MPAPTIEQTLVSLLRPGVEPKALLAEVRAVHPEATKKEIIQAAFIAVVSLAENNAEKSRLLQDFALRGRGGDE